MLYRPEIECAARESIRAHQLARLNALLAEALPHNRLYAARYGETKLPLDWRSFEALPFIGKANLVADQQAYPPLGQVATYAEREYVAYHQTSGTTGRPLRVLDTAASWAWWRECWQYVYAGAGVTAEDRIFFAFGFGPFVGFWAAFEGARDLGALTLPAGGMDTLRRLEMLREQRATVLLCTPSYALRMLEQARELGIDLRDTDVRTTIHAGEPGASIPSVRAQIEAGWGARCYDHAGATEIGAFGYPCEAQTGLHINEAEFIAEILDTASARQAGEGQEGELVLTNLGRAGWPAIRYRTGDRVRHGGYRCACGRTTLLLPGGILGRADDMLIVRGVNIFPSAIEAIVREFPEVAEFRITVTRVGARDELALEVETAVEGCDARVAQALHTRLNLRIVVQAVPPATLPRWELKARRVVDRRSEY